MFVTTLAISLSPAPHRKNEASVKISPYPPPSASASPSLDGPQQAGMPTTMSKPMSMLRPKEVLLLRHSTAESATKRCLRQPAVLSPRISNSINPFKQNFAKPHPIPESASAASGSPDSASASPPDKTPFRRDSRRHRTAAIRRFGDGGRRTRAVGRASRCGWRCGTGGRADKRGRRRCGGRASGGEGG